MWLHFWSPCKPGVNGPRRAGNGLTGPGRSFTVTVVLKDPFAGIFEFAQHIVGMANLLTLMAANRPVAEALFDKPLALKLAFWELALPHQADVPPQNVVAMVEALREYGGYL